MTTEELRFRDLRDEVRRAERQLAAALGRDPDAPLSTLQFLVAEAAARVRSTGGTTAPAADPPGDGAPRGDPDPGRGAAPEGQVRVTVASISPYGRSAA